MDESSILRRRGLQKELSLPRRGSLVTGNLKPIPGSVGNKTGLSGSDMTPSLGFWQLLSISSFSTYEIPACGLPSGRAAWLIIDDG
ncbi:hypothetical protein AMELA_G00253030 [Ameiurus melas]|uniref:Uncharacterized protein n=1 Tax=Ameiurus melas TaxID=219545 RepID=A0A7J5ZR02_AMEME|nr:hypothetical protein AMELA_G00253030 [Ameiurus melas]